MSGHAPVTAGHTQQIQPPPQEVIAQIVENQTKELEIKQKELILADSNSERQFVFAGKQLEAQERDRQEERRSKERLFDHGLYAAVSVLIAVCVFFAYCINQGKDAIVVELFKVLCYGGSFGAGGFAWGRYGKPEVGKK